MVKIEKEKMEDCCAPSEGDEMRYPYGTKLSFEDELVSSLGLDGAAVGTELLVFAKVTVASVSKSENEDTTSSRKHTCVELQLTEVETRPVKSVTEQMYGV